MAIGIKPNTQLAESAGLEVDKNNGGVVVNQELAARSDLYVVCISISFFLLLQYILIYANTRLAMLSHTTIQFWVAVVSSITTMPTTAVVTRL